MRQVAVSCACVTSWTGAAARIRMNAQLIDAREGGRHSGPSAWHRLLTHVGRRRLGDPVCSCPNRERVMTPKTPRTFPNRILLWLSPAAFALLEKHRTAVDLPLRKQLEMRP